jgi:hypothetical protein
MVEITSIKKRVLGPENRKRTVWVLNYHDKEGKEKRKTFKHRCDAEAFTEILRVFGDGTVFIDDDKLDYAISQRDYYGEVAKPLTIRAIIHLIEKFIHTTTRLSDSERAFFTTLASDADCEGRNLIIEDRFLRAAIEGGKTLKTYSYHVPDSDYGGWIGLHRFFGMYVVNTTEYGEGQEDFGPFANIKDGKAVFDAAIALGVPPDAKRVR